MLLYVYQFDRQAQSFIAGIISFVIRLHFSIIFTVTFFFPSLVLCCESDGLFAV